MSSLTPHSALAALLQRAGFDQDPSEYHGALCGALCVRGSSEVDPLRLLERVAIEAPPPEVQGPLASLRDATARDLADADSGIRLLLPDDEQPLALRARALGQWCEGFLFGLASRGGLNLAQASAEVREVVEDLSQFTRAEFNDGDNAEIEEEAYAELVEYVRVGLQLVFVELVPRANIAGNETVH
ncbi:MAG: UPF0149 family protein [Stagnimonas sp.]|nr:UPF0149 family protein [Stagnimonas sp.]